MPSLFWIKTLSTYQTCGMVTFQFFNTITRGQCKSISVRKKNKQKNYRHFISIYPFYALCCFDLYLILLISENIPSVMECFLDLDILNIYIVNIGHVWLKYVNHAENSHRCYRQRAKRGHWQHLKTDSTGIAYSQVCAVVWPHYSTLGYVTGFGLGEPLQWHCGFLRTHCLPSWALCAFIFTETLHVLSKTEQQFRQTKITTKMLIPVFVPSRTQKLFMVSLKYRPLRYWYKQSTVSTVEHSTPVFH